MSAHALSGMDVLLSRATWSPWLAQYAPTFAHVLIDSGAFSELNSGVAVDLVEYRDWSESWRTGAHGLVADAIAGLDDISGDWRRSLKNYAEGGGFPTLHDTDPPELLEDLITLARERGRWIGLGLLPPRTGRDAWLRRTLDRIPDDLHVHLWAGRAYTYLRRIDSVDSTNWFRDAMWLRERGGLGWLTLAECTDLVVRRYQRARPNVESDGGEQDAFC